MKPATPVKKKESISVLDRLLNKPVTVTLKKPLKELGLTHGDFVVYADQDKKEQVGEYLGYTTPADKSGTYIRSVKGREVDRFETNKEKSQEYFTLFKKEFSKEFPDAILITARMSLYGNQIYFYFFSEQRYNFSAFVRAFREKIPMKFFIYQVGPRDRIRFYEHRHERFDANGLPLMYSLFKHPLPQVDNDVIIKQGLRGRHSEALKDRSGKFDHTLNFEAEIYAAEIPKYPRKGQIITHDGKKMMCTGYNILTQEISLRGESRDTKGKFYGEFESITIDQYSPKKRKKIS